jgi:hypothetical protein
MAGRSHHVASERRRSVAVDCFLARIFCSDHLLPSSSHSTLPFVPSLFRQRVCPGMASVLRHVFCCGCGRRDHGRVCIFVFVHFATLAHICLYLKNDDDEANEHTPFIRPQRSEDEPSYVIQFISPVTETSHPLTGAATLAMS